MCKGRFCTFPLLHSIFSFSATFSTRQTPQLLDPAEEGLGCGEESFHRQREKSLTTKYKHEILFIKWNVLDVLDSSILKMSEHLKVWGGKQVYSHNVSTFKLQLQFCNSRTDVGSRCFKDLKIPVLYCMSRCIWHGMLWLNILAYVINKYVCKGFIKTKWT